ncbi:arginine metabolism regulation protein II [Rhinocladiella similis]
MVSKRILEPSAISRAEVLGIQSRLSRTDQNKRPASTSNALFSVFTTQPHEATTPKDLQKSPLEEPTVRENIEINLACGSSEVTSEPVRNEQAAPPLEGDLDSGISAYLGSSNVYHDIGEDLDSSIYNDIGTACLAPERLETRQLRRDTSSWQASGNFSDGESSCSSYENMLTKTASYEHLSLDDALLSPASINDHELPRLTESSFSGPSLHLDLLPMPSDQCELIHHWINFLSMSMSPVVKEDSSHHTRLTPMALSGLNSDSRRSSGGIAVFHGICAASAFNLSNVKGNDERFWRLGIRHRRLALYHLRHSMQSNASTKDDSVWAAIWTFLYQEGVRGQAYEWRTHVEGLRSLILADPEAIQRSDLARTVYESFLCLTIMGNVQLDAELTTLMEKLPPDLDYLQPVHGITRVLLEIILKISSHATPPSSQVDITADRIELQLLLYCPANITTAGLDEDAARTLVRYSHVYYDATRIHFQRLLRKKDPTLLQDLVAGAIGHLEAIEVDQTNPHGCIWVWPALVIAAECTDLHLQQRMLAWFRSKRRHGFRNLDVACDLARKVWATRVESTLGSNIHWHDFIHDTKYDVLPL